MSAYPPGPPGPPPPPQPRLPNPGRPNEELARRGASPVVALLFALSGLVVGLVVGLPAGCAVGSASPTTAEPAATVTAPAPAPRTVTAPPAPGATKTVRVPGPTTTVTQEPPRADPGGPSEGINEVGVDVEPGRWKSTVPEDSPGCYWARLKSDEGTLESVIANESAEPGELVSVTIAKSDQFFETGGCGEWARP